MILTSKQQQILIGSILGDGNLSGNWSKTNYRLKISHSVKQSEYIWWKYEILKDLVLTKPQVYDKTKSISFRTISHNELSKFYKLFYPNGKKVIPKNIETLIKNPIILAVWFMDDGNAVKNDDYLHGYHLNTQSFSEKENKMLTDAMKMIHGIECSIQKNNGYVRLFVRAQSKQKFISLIRRYIIPSMRYKIG